MTTFIPFNPSNSNNPPFQTSLTLDGMIYLASGLWNISGQRWYLQIHDQYGNLVWNGALIGSPSGYDIYLAYGVFSTSTIVYRSGTGNIEVNP